MHATNSFWLTRKCWFQVQSLCVIYLQTFKTPVFKLGWGIQKCLDIMQPHYSFMNCKLLKGQVTYDNWFNMVNTSNTDSVDNSLECFSNVVWDCVSLWSGGYLKYSLNQEVVVSHTISTLLPKVNQRMTWLQIIPECYMPELALIYSAKCARNNPDWLLVHIFQKSLGGLTAIWTTSLGL